MEIARFVARYPRLYHATFVENDAPIRSHGLLTPADILRRSGWSESRIDDALSRPRPQCLEVDWPDGTRVTLRDQKPLRVVHLKAAFANISPTEYVRNLGARVFFWCLNTKMTKASDTDYYGRRQTVFVFDTAKLFEDHASGIELCRVNSGTLLMPSAVGSEVNRNPRTMFAKLSECDWRLGEIKEVTLRHSLCSVSPYLARD